MIDPRLETLIHEALDGVLDESRREELLRGLAADPEAAAYRDDLRRLHELLAAVPREDPPAALRTGVMRALEAEAPSSAPARVRARTVAFPAWLAVRPRLGYALALAGAAMLGLLYLVTRPQTPTSPEALRGTLAPPTGNEMGAPLWQEDLALAGVPAGAAAFRADRSVAIEIRADAPCEVVLRFDAGAYRLRGMRDADGREILVREIPGGLHATIPGRGRWRLGLEASGPRPADLALRVSSGGATIERVIRWEEPGRGEPDGGTR